eukprot:m.112881 g.112881  ORF g.112881 m.112881 type:complete len:204 (+) comp15341_c1_seq1:109-720(+)
MGPAVKFKVQLCIEALYAVPYQNAILFCKIKHPNGTLYTSRQAVQDNVVRWNETFDFPIKTKLRKDGFLDPKVIKVSVRREIDGGRRDAKMGYAPVNAAEYAGRTNADRRYLLQSDKATARQDNSVLKVIVSMELMEGPTVFKASPPESVVPRATSFAETEVERLEMDAISYHSSSTPRPLSEVREISDEIIDEIIAAHGGAV